MIPSPSHRTITLPRSLLRNIATLSVLSWLAAYYLLGQSPDVDDLFRQGAIAMRAGRYAEAESAFRHAVQLAPKLPEAHLDLGLVLGREGKFEEAIHSIHRALDLNPALPSAHLFAGIFLYQSGRVPEARKELETELARSPKNVETLSWLGTISLSQGHAEEAAGFFDRAVHLAPDDLALLEFRGRAHSMIAHDSYAHMTKLDPNSWHVHRVQAQLYADGGNHVDAVTEYQTAIKLETRNPDLYEALGDEYRTLKNLDSAAEAYRQGLALEPTNPVALYNLGSTLIELGDASEGVSLLTKMTQTYSDAPLLAYYLGRGLALQGHDEQAMNWLEKGITAGAQGEVAKRSWYELSSLYRKHNRPADSELALKNFNQIREAEEKADRLQIQDWMKFQQITAEEQNPSPSRH